MAAERGAREARPGERETPALRRVLVPTDLSEGAARALPWAYALAGRGGSVVLLHVIEPSVAPNPLYAHYERGSAASEADRSVQIAAIRERLRAIEPADAAGRGIATEVEVLESAAVAECVCGAAERLGIDAICIASRGRGVLLRTLLGSVAEDLLHAARIPLFVIPPR